MFGYIFMGGLVFGKCIVEVLVEQGGVFVYGLIYFGYLVVVVVVIVNFKVLCDEGVVMWVREEIGFYL